MNIREINLRERKHAGTRVALLERMKEELVKKTFEKISVRELCDAIPISEVTFFNYFRNKDELIVYFIQIWSIEVEYHTKTILKGKSGIEQIEYIFGHAASVMEEIPNLMSEIISFVAKNFTEIRFKKISVAEKLIAFPDLPGIQEYDAVMINDLFAERIKKAVDEGELPGSTDVGLLTFSLISVFFGTPIGWTRLEPKKVREMYKNHLDMLWKGIKKN